MLIRLLQIILYSNVVQLVIVWIVTKTATAGSLGFMMGGCPQGVRIIDR